MANPRGRPKKDPDADYDPEDAVAEAIAAASAEDQAAARLVQLETVARLRGKAEKDRSYGAAAGLFKVEQEIIRRIHLDRERGTRGY